MHHPMDLAYEIGNILFRKREDDSDLKDPGGKVLGLYDPICIFARDQVKEHLMRSIKGFVNVWESAVELQSRQEEGRQLAKSLFGQDPRWENRCINLAQGLSDNNWNLVRRLSKEQVIEIIETMIGQGFPGDYPWEKDVAKLQ